MRDTVVVGCGGGGCGTVSQITTLSDVPAFTINAANADVVVPVRNGGAESFKGRRDAAYSGALNMRAEISSRISGFGNVIAVATLGGGAGFGIVYALSQCAKEAGANFVAAVTIPFAFETDRRPAAEREAEAATRFADRVIVMDMQRLVDMGGLGMGAGRAIAAADLMVSNAVITIARLLEGTPFFSTMTQKSYSFSYGDGSCVAKSVEAAMSQPMFELDPAEGKAVICLDARVDPREAEHVARLVADRTGIVPEVIQGEAPGGFGATVFMPVSLRSLPSATAYELDGVAEDAHDGVVLVLRGDGAAHHPAEHHRRRLPPFGGVADPVEEVAELLEHQRLLAAVGGGHADALHFGLEHLV